MVSFQCQSLHPRALGLFLEVQKAVVYELPVLEMLRASQHSGS